MWTTLVRFIGGWQGYAIIAGFAAIGSLWIMHAIDEGRYARLQAEVARNHAHQLAQAVADQAAFDKKQLEAQAAAFAAKQAALSAAQQQLAQLEAALNKARQHDATLDRCLRIQLPADVMQSLPH